MIVIDRRRPVVTLPTVATGFTDLMREVIAPRRAVARSTPRIRPRLIVDQSPAANLSRPAPTDAGRRLFVRNYAVASDVITTSAKTAIGRMYAPRQTIFALPADAQSLADPISSSSSILYCKVHITRNT